MSLASVWELLCDFMMIGRVTCGTWNGCQEVDNSNQDSGMRGGGAHSARITIIKLKICLWKNCLEPSTS